MTTQTARRLVPAILSCAMLVLTIAYLAGCDKTDGGWQQLQNPNPEEQPDLTLLVDYQPANDDHVNQGEEIGFRVQIANNGSVAAADVVVTITQPEILTDVSVQENRGIFDIETGLWDLDRLEPGARDTLNILATVPQETIGEILHFSAAILSSDPADSNRGDNEVSLQVPVVGNPPDANDDSYVVLETAILTVNPPGLMTNDFDFLGESIHLDTVPVEDPGHGQLTLLENGGFEYRHDGSEALADSFRYRLIDASAESDTATVRMHIVLVNDPPVIVGLESFSVDEGDTFPIIDLKPHATDDDNEQADLRWQVFAAGDLTATLSETYELTVTQPDTNWNGSEIIVLRLTDPEEANTQVSVPFTVNSINDDPVMAILPSQTVVQGGGFLPIPLDYFVSDVDHEPEEMTWTFRDYQPLLVQIDEDRNLLVRPPDGSYTGGVTITLRVTDPEGSWVEGTSTFEVLPAY